MFPIQMWVVTDSLNLWKQNLQTCSLIFESYKLPLCQNVPPLVFTIVCTRIIIAVKMLLIYMTNNHHKVTFNFVQTFIKSYFTDRGHGGHCFGAPTNGLGALENSLLFCYSLTGNGLGLLSCPFKMALKCVPFKICNLSAGIEASNWEQIMLFWLYAYPFSVSHQTVAASNSRRT